ncbi:S24 family peptidase [Aliarcobacter butzleri]|jgi:hypothetical protein|uniref:S24 family peptidase n=1 Tax=Aliarcobacter TaxID=2321111 RepID=UPI0021B64C6F|nr:MULTISPECIES: S24 family peptidase [Aliarcobacter]MCT7499499.1 S24 family peptidase [Aliarcobacter cryaerophilus]MCT7613755.1 S24 family peptidase [Aliarcobacter butzleri]
MRDFKEIIEKLKDILSKELGNVIIKDKDIAKALDIDYNVFRKNKQYNKIPYFQIMQFLAKRNISINYFFFNQLPESLIEPTSKYIILKYYSNITSSAGTGILNYQLHSEPFIIDTQILDYLNSNYNYTEIIKARGDSMIPIIQDDSLLFIDTSIKHINHKGIYVVNIQGELFVKQISYKDNHILLKSLNKEYNDIKVKDLTIIGKIKGILNPI